VPPRSKGRNAGVPVVSGPPQLLVPRDQLQSEIDERLELAREFVQRPIADRAQLAALSNDFYTWSDYNKALLRRSFDVPEVADEYSRSIGIFGSATGLAAQHKELREDIAFKVRRLESVRERLPLYAEHPDMTTPAPPPPEPVLVGEDIFVVHGHDTATKETVARFLARLLGRQPVILHEQVNAGRTIIEKFEDHARAAAAAVVLLTGDDEGGVAGEPARRRRARQNVILELGYFVGKLGRERVVILYEPGVETPSDLLGVLYVELDAAGAWKMQLARELKAAGLDTDLQALVDA
jgi:predicted nucleotide-binding protein